MEEIIKKSNIIETEYGKVEGKIEDSCIKYLGIPFAKVPINELTFKHPLKCDKWEGIYKAYYGKKNPIQGSGILNCTNNSLDCLYLNIYIPFHKENEKLPVAIWIFGGSYKSGGSGEINTTTHELKYDATSLCKSLHSIVVTFNYRLSLYGFLNLHFLNKDFDLNNGLYDQIMAIKFVNDNIKNFDGDTNNITLFGQSAGAGSIFALLSVKEISSLFNKVIMMSPVLEHYFTYEESKKITLKYLKYLKINQNNLNSLYSLDPEIIKKANSKIKMYVLKKGDNRCAFSPIIDGELLKEHPKKLVKEANKPVLIGNVKNESNLFVFDIPSFLLPLLSKYMGFEYQKNNKLSIKENCFNSLTYSIYKKPIYKFLYTYKGEAYKYEYRFISPYLKKKGIDCFHACDVPVLFLFNTYYEKVGDELTKKASQKQRELFKKFIHNDFKEYKEFKFDKNEIIID